MQSSSRRRSGSRRRREAGKQQEQRRSSGQQLEGSSNCQRTFVAVVIAFYGLCLSAMVVVVAISPEGGSPLCSHWSTQRVVVVVAAPPQCLKRPQYVGLGID